MQTIATTTAQIIEVIAAYAAQMQVINAVTPGPGWTRIGAFYMPVLATVRLEVIGLVSVNTNVLSVRLYDVALAAVVSGSVTPDLIDTAFEVRKVSGAFDLAGGKVYRIEAQVIGAGGNGTVVSSTLVGG